MDNLELEFSGLISQIASILGPSHQTDSEAALEDCFSGASRQQQVEMTSRARCELEQMELLREKVTDADRLRFICAAHKFRSVDDEIFSCLTRGMCWEVVDLDFNQLYRNDKIFNEVSYTLAEMEAYNPFELFKRPQQIVEQQGEVLGAIKASNALMDLKGMPPYIIEEARSVEKRQFEVFHKAACLLKDIGSGEARAFVSVFECRAISRKDKVSIFAH